MIIKLAIGNPMPVTGYNMDSHSCGQGSNPGTANHAIRYALNSIQLISDESSDKLMLYLCE